MCVPKVITFCKPVDGSGRTFFSYTALDNSRDPIFRMDIISHAFFRVRTMIAGITKRKELNFSKKIHRFVHTYPEEVKMMINVSGLGSAAMDKVCEKVYNACTFSKSTVRPFIKKISFTNLNQTFNEDMQADFKTVFIRDTKYKVPNIFDMEASEGLPITATTNVATMMNLFEVMWISGHEALKSFRADPNFSKPVLCSGCSTCMA